jgi:pimeloyl-ACP methyl ester carboxylesterase
MLGDWTTTLGFDRLTAPSKEAGFRPIDPEAMATVREAVLLPYDLAPVVPDAKAGEDVVVLLHGFMATAGVFRPLKTRLERERGVHVASFTHAPGIGIRRIAAQLADLVRKLHPAARVHLVGHSLGGVVARWYVQELGGHRRVAQTISLGSPFGGARVAHHLPLFIGAELHGQSSLLVKIRAHAHRGAVPHTSVIGGADRLVFPAESARFPTGDAVVLPGRGHNMLLFDEEVAGLILRRVRDARKAAT